MTDYPAEKALVATLTPKGREWLVGQLSHRIAAERREADRCCAAYTNPAGTYYAPAMLLAMAHDGSAGLYESLLVKVGASEP